jgi:hypothetical protein
VGQNQRQQTPNQARKVVCTYCDIPFHKYADCRKRIEDEGKGIFRPKYSYPVQNQSQQRQPQATKGKKGKRKKGKARQVQVDETQISNYKECEPSASTNRAEAESQMRRDLCQAMSVDTQPRFRAMPAMALPEEAFCKQAKAYMTGEERRIFAELTWNMDTGANVHLTFRRDWLRDPIIPVNIPISLAGKNTVLYATLQGDVMLRMSDDLGYLLIREVLYSPEVADNLISPVRLDEKGAYTGFGVAKAQITDLVTGELLGKGKLINRVYVLTADTILERTVTSCHLSHE